MPDVKVTMVTAHGGHRLHVSADTVAFETPPVEHLLFYAGLGALASFEVIEWPIAGLLMAGHLLMEATHRPGLEELGEALGAA